MKSKNTICLWFDKDALENGNFYSATFPNSEMTAVHKAPADCPSGKAGDVITVEFTVLGSPCLGLNGGPAFRHSEAFSFQIATDNQAETDRGFRTQSSSDGFSALHDVLAEGLDDVHQLLMLSCRHLVLVKGL